MPTYKTRAIILSSQPYREHDRIVSFYSEDYGRIDARARGCRKLASKLAGHLEPFVETELLLAWGRHWDILAGSRTVAAQARVRSQLELAAAAAVCCEAVKLISKPLAPDRRVWLLLSETLSELDRLTPKARIKKEPALGSFLGVSPLPDSHSQLYHTLVLGARQRIDRFLWNLLCFSGFAPEMKKCIHCRRHIQSGFFSREGGGALCVDCCGRDGLAVKMEPGDLAALSGGQSTLSEQARQVVIGWWQTVVSHAPLRSLEFLESLIV